MKKHGSSYIKNLLLPCLAFSVFAGVMSSLIITLFKWAAEHVISLSLWLYSVARQSPLWLLLLVLGVAAVGFSASLILSLSHACRGGGIPTSIAAIRGIANFKWLASLLVLPVSALLTFLCGLPLGTEGPCVQMGTAIGDGAVKLLGGKRHAGWRRYIMTGGAAAGFSLATGAPLTAIIFSTEELHKRFSPLLFSVTALSVLVSGICARALRALGIGTVGLFDISTTQALPLKVLFAPLAIGLICGGVSVLFTKLYHKFDALMRIKLAKISTKIKFPLIFSSFAIIGYFIPKILGTGHSLTEEMLHSSDVWYVLIVVFLLRAVFMMLSNTAGVTGGIFLPTLAFGALIGALSADAFISLGIVDKSHYILFVTLGMTAFLASTSHIPLTACVFAIEALGAGQNILAVIIAVSAAYLIVELSGQEDFTDTVIETKAHAIHRGKEARVIEVPLTVYKDSFVIGKELQDILWPVSCVVLSIEKKAAVSGRTRISEGDVLTVHYKTYDPVATAEEFEALVGDQPEDVDRVMRPE